MLFVKPTTTDSKTNMTVVTSAHTYYFSLTSHSLTPKATSSKTAPTSTYAVHFIYPEALKQQILAKMKRQKTKRQASISPFQNPTHYHWDYTFNGDRTIMPIHVFDDGKFTYLQLRPNHPVPAVFSVTSPSGKESVVNTRTQGQYLVIETTAPQFTLREGHDHVASLFNRAEIDKYWHHQSMGAGK